MEDQEISEREWRRQLFTVKDIVKRKKIKDDKQIVKEAMRCNMTKEEAEWALEKLGEYHEI